MKMSRRLVLLLYILDGRFKDTCIFKLVYDNIRNIRKLGMFILKYLLTLLIAFILVGCGGDTPKPEAVVYPSWYLNPPHNDGSFLYGVGEGNDINVAKASALSFIAESLSLTVSSELKKSDSSSRYNGNENTYSSVVSSLKTQAKEMEFSEYQIIKNEQVGSKIILLVKVSRHKLFEDQKAKLELFSNDLKAEKKSISKYPILKQALLYKQRAQKQHTLKSLALLGKTINSGFDTSAYIHQAAEVADASQDALNTVKISITASRQAEIFVEAIKEGLNNAGIKTGSKNSNTQLHLENAFQLDEIYGFKIAKSRLSLSTKEKNKTIATNALVLSGKSRYDYNKAKLSANTVLRQKIKEEGIFSILGVQ